MARGGIELATRGFLGIRPVMAALTGLGGEIDGREELWGDIPGQQLFNTIDGVIGNTSQHLAQIRLRV